MLLKTTRTGILLINLGTPNSAKVSDIRQYLKQFLSDPRVIDIPAILRWLLVNVLILPFRPQKIQKAYEAIWTTQGSPLLVFSQRQQELVAQGLGENYVVELGMRYGQPSIESGIHKLLAKNCDHIKILPLFPQYASSSTGSAIEEALRVIAVGNIVPSFEVLGDFYNHPQFVANLAAVTQEHLNNFPSDFILMSYHGLPERHTQRTHRNGFACTSLAPCPSVCEDNRFCYRAQCYETSRALATVLNLASHQYGVSFQSRLGRTPWIKPYTDHQLSELAKRGIQHLSVICPSFVSDCLETLEEIGIRAREQWLSVGGKTLHLVPCLNDHPEWIQMLVGLLKNN